MLIEQAIKDSLEQIEIASMDIDAELDMDAMWDNTIWQEIEEIGETIYGEVEQVTSVAGVRGAEAEDEALGYLYYRRSIFWIFERYVWKSKYFNIWRTNHGLASSK